MSTQIVAYLLMPILGGAVGLFFRTVNDPDRNAWLIVAIGVAAFVLTDYYNLTLLLIWQAKLGLIHGALYLVGFWLVLTRGFRANA